MVASELMNIINKFDSDQIDLLIMRPVDSKLIWIDILIIKLKKLICNIQIEYTPDKTTITKRKNLLDRGEQLGEIDLFNLFYVIGSCVNLDKCIFYGY